MDPNDADPPDWYDKVLSSKIGLPSKKDIKQPTNIVFHKSKVYRTKKQPSDKNNKPINKKQNKHFEHHILHNQSQQFNIKPVKTITVIPD